MLVTVLAVVIFVFAFFQLAAFPAGFMTFAAEALAVTRTVTWNTCRPQIRRVLAVTG